MGCGGFPADDEKGTIRREVLRDYAKRLPSANLEHKVYCSNPKCNEIIENNMPAIKTFYGYFHTDDCYNYVRDNIFNFLPKLPDSEVHEISRVKIVYK